MMPTTPTSRELIDQHLTSLAAQGYAKTTIALTRVLLLRAERELPKTLATAEIGEVEELLARQKCAQSKATNQIALTRFTAWAAARGKTDRDALAALVLPHIPRRLPRPFTPEQAAACLALQPPYGTYAHLAFYAGLRACEISQLHTDDVDEHTVHVLDGKGGKDRDIPTDPVLWGVIQTLPRGHLLPNAIDRPDLAARYVSQRTAKLIRQMVGGQRVGLHNLRHTYATDLLEAGVDIRYIQVLMGHASIESTVIYTEVSSVRLVDAMRRLSEHRPAVTRPVPDAAKAA